jgi:hypothetical protein
MCNGTGSNYTTGWTSDAVCRICNGKKIIHTETGMPPEDTYEYVIEEDFQKESGFEIDVKEDFGELRLWIKCSDGHWNSFNIKDPAREIPKLIDALVDYMSKCNPGAAIRGE